MSRLIDRCERCGGPMYHRPPRAKTCSNACRQARYRERQRTSRHPHRVDFITRDHASDRRRYISAAT